MWDTDMDVKGKLDMIIRLAEVGYYVETDQLDELMNLRFQKMVNTAPIKPLPTNDNIE